MSGRGAWSLKSGRGFISRSRRQNDEAVTKFLTLYLAVSGALSLAATARLRSDSRVPPSACDCEHSSPVCGAYYQYYQSAVQAIACPKQAWG